MTDNAEIIHAIPDYDGPGVYALVDQDGKKYIGSSLNVKKRLCSHKTSLQRCLHGGNPNSGEKLKRAVLSGITFDAAIIQVLPDGGCLYDLLEMERHAIENAGGIENTYNSVEIKDYRASDIQSLEYFKNDDDMLQHIQGLISKREKPIYFSANLDRLSVAAPKGTKARWKAAAEAQGESVNGFINRAIEETMERDLKRNTGEDE